MRTSPFYEEDAIKILASELSGEDARVRAENMVKTSLYGHIPICSNGHDGTMIWLMRTNTRWLISDTDPRIFLKHGEAD